MARRLTLLVVMSLVSLTFFVPAQAREPAGTTIPWDLLDCQFVYGIAVIPGQRLAPYMPEGFRMALGGNTPAGGNLPAEVGFEVDICREGAGLHGQIAPMTYASTWTQAIPPPALSVPGVAMFVTWDVLIPDEERREALQAVGAPAYDGTAHISADLSAPVMTPFRVDYELEGAGSFAFDIFGVPAGAAAASGEFAQYVPGDDGSLTYWRTRWSADASQRSAGVIHLDPNSWQAEAFGTTVIPARFSYGTWDYTNGKIVLPAT